GAAALVLAFGANVWFAASGMEVLPLAWLLLRAVRRAAEWCEEPARFRRGRRRELVALAWLLPLMRPEGVLGTLLVGSVLGLRPRAGSRLWGLLAVAGTFLPASINWLLTGQLSSTTLHAKWLPLNPYVTPASLLAAFVDYVELLVTTLLNGEVWSALFLPLGSAPVALACLIALPLAGLDRHLRPRATLLTLLALGILIPASYDCPLCNRLRYLWPFFPAWMVGAAALAERVARPFARRAIELEAEGPLSIGSFAGALAGYLPFAVEDISASTRAIYDQQVWLASWARDSLPKSARIGVNDTGAISYYTGRQTFDIVGLTTLEEARYWTAGPGSRFEHYERLGPRRLPTHFIVYPQWFAISALLGTELAERTIRGATILGGEHMGAYVADYSRLGSGERPDATLARGRTVLDTLDVADLESEAQHGYQLLDAEQRHNLVLDAGDKLDGARQGRERDMFELTLQPRGTLLLRVATETPQTLRVRLQARELRVAVPAATWHETGIELPADLVPGRTSVTVLASSGTFTSLHYFSLAP
ncbi:MAG TPA: hypothetical protein VER33_06755, partial [Polyangiaceae bacterium]|nr:hypothetical protein [Polyangiaceae bacterium]